VNAVTVTRELLAKHKPLRTPTWAASKMMDRETWKDRYDQTQTLMNHAVQDALVWVILISAFSMEPIAFADIVTVHRRNTAEYQMPNVKWDVLEIKNKNVETVGEIRCFQQVLLARGHYTIVLANQQ